MRQGIAERCIWGRIQGWGGGGGGGGQLLCDLSITVSPDLLVDQSFTDLDFVVEYVIFCLSNVGCMHAVCVLQCSSVVK